MLEECYQNHGSDIAGTQYDVAHVKWGGFWLMPSLSQFEELLDNSTSTWTSREGVYGRQFTGRNGGTIFLPAVGNRSHEHILGTDYTGIYWSSTQDVSYLDCSYYISFLEGGIGWGPGRRSSSATVRPVISRTTNINLP